MMRIPQNKAPQFLCIAKGRQRTVDQANNLAEPYLRRSPAEPVAALCTPHALHQSGIPQFNQDQFEKLSRQITISSDLPDLECSLLIVTRQRHHRLQSVESLLRDFHGRILPITMASIAAVASRFSQIPYRTVFQKRIATHYLLNSS
jgi:hypothetical protein